MSSTVRRHRRERARRRGAVILKCHVCGREGPRRSMVHRNERWVCRRIPACMERVFNPPPPPSPRRLTPPFTRPFPAVPTKRFYDNLGKIHDSFNKSAAAFREFQAGFQPIGYMSEDGIQHHADTP